VLVVGDTSFAREGTDPRSLERSTVVERRFALKCFLLMLGEPSGRAFKAFLGRPWASPFIGTRM
jgi:hypothetical protein